MESAFAGSTAAETKSAPAAVCCAGTLAEHAPLRVLLAHQSMQAP
jgi:hypothetical protein